MFVSLTREAVLNTRSNGWLSLLVVVGSVGLLACGGGTPAAEDGGTGGGAGGGAGGSLAIVATVPAAGAAEVSATVDVTVSFSKAVAAGSLSLSLSPSAAVPTPSLGSDGTEATWPGLTLTAGTQYTVTVSAKDADGNALGGDASFTFTTAAAVDSVAPTLVSTMPANNAANVATTTGVAVTFSEAMDQGSVIVVIEPAIDLGEPSWNGDRTQLTFPSAAPFAASTAYGMQVSGADLAGNALMADAVVFATAAPPDTTPPTVSSSAPASQAMDVPTNAVLSLSFSEPMDQASVDTAFSISPFVAGTALWDASGTLRSYQPTAPLAAGTTYTVTLSTVAKDLAANQLAQAYSASFTTAAAPDTTRPTLVSSTPAAAEKGVARSATISLEFSEPMDKAATQAAFDITAPASANMGTFSWSADGKTMTFTPSAPFDYGTIVAWRLSTAARDLAGNTMQPSVIRGFQIINEGVAVLDSVMGIDGYVTNGGTSYTSSGYILFGDSAQNIAYRGFLSFDLSSLPASLTTIKSALVYVYLASVSGAPVTALGGGPRIEHVNVGASLDAMDYDTANIAGPGEYGALPSTTTTNWKLTSVMLGAVKADWQNRASLGNRTQFRLRFPNQLAANSTGDYFAIYAGNTSAVTCPRTNSHATGSSCRPHLVVVYEYQ